MAHRKQWAKCSGAVLLGLALASSGCSFLKKKGKHGGGDEAAAGASQDGGAAAANAPLGDQTPGLSLRGHVRFKRIRLLRNDFALALQMPADQLCKENDRDCFENYRVALGGHDLPLVLFTSAEDPIVTTPIAVERIALQACSKRVNADLAGSPVIFKDVKAGDNSYTPAMAAAGTALYRGFVRRDPTASEAQGLQLLFGNIQAKVPAGSAGKTWAQMACWTVATSLESVLY